MSRVILYSEVKESIYLQFIFTFLRNCFLRGFCTQLNDIKYSYLTQIIYTQLYGLEYSSLILVT